MEQLLKRKSTILLFILPVLIVYTVIIPVPIVSSVYFSLTKWNLVDTIKFVGFNNYKYLFTQDNLFYLAIKNTLVYLVLSAIFQLPMAFLLASLLSRGRRGQSFFRNVIFLPVTFSSVAISLMWYFVYHPQVGFLNHLLDLVGLSKWKHAWLADAKTALFAVIICVAWQFVGYHMNIYLAGMTTVPSELVEAAKIDGANRWQITKHIVVPFLMPMLRVSIIMITTSSLKSFDSIYVMTQGGPNHATEVLGSMMYTDTFAQMQYGYGSAISTVLLLLGIAATLLITKIFDKLKYEM